MFFNRTPEEKLFKAVTKGKLDRVRDLVEGGVNVNAQNENQNPVLLLAAEKGHIEVIEYLLDKGAELNACNDNGHTALMFASFSGWVETVKLLIGRGTNLSVKDHEGNTACTWAQKAGHAEIVALINAALEPERKKKEEMARRRKKKEREQRLRAEKQALQPQEKWVKMGADQIAFIGVYPEAETELKHIFNFADRHRLTTIENTVTHIEVSPPAIRFDDLPASELERALKMFTSKGGVADRDFVMNGTVRLANKL